MADQGTPEHGESVPPTLSSSEVLEILFGDRNSAASSLKATDDISSEAHDTRHGWKRWWRGSGAGKGLAGNVAIMVPSRSFSTFSLTFALDRR